MIYGYTKVSTKKQAKGGNSLEGQEKALKEAVALEIHHDSFTGTKSARPELAKLLSKLDRFARSLSQGSEMVNELVEKGVKVHILNIGIMGNTPSSKSIRNIFFSFAEFERDIVIERTQEGKAIAKTKNGYTEDRPQKFTNFQIQEAVKMKRQLGYTYKEIEIHTRISPPLIRAVKKYRDELAANQIPEIGQLPGQTKLN